MSVVEETVLSTLNYAAAKGFISNLTLKSDLEFYVLRVDDLDTDFLGCHFKKCGVLFFGLKSYLHFRNIESVEWEL